MRELDCDFCGATAAGAYEVVPADLDPAPDEQVRVVLCPACRDTLDDVLAPLLDRLDADAPTPESSEPPAIDDDAAGHASPNASPPADDGVDHDPVDSATDAAGRSLAAADPDPDPDPNPDADPDLNGDPEPDGDDENDADPDDPAGADVSAVAASGSDVAGGDAEPPAFRKVMRLLNNREFPVERAAVTELAAGAYDLDDREVDEILEHAIDRGILAEDGNRLRKA
ncbi:hypothetical protein Hbl1158_01485 [Halobaculum sp. CBA1158]|uniref:hypothetical protein n=1 Tax=Halobaculum sp. CBA1158 TaxID=2904243 RepID=UPI001F258A0A|nr:hypothetical protein [Halobaculum sp. CBA1158]UIP00072.1 hypothetical protein Hbl1158_01485 [Halobaculum sp. CBA1158]